MNTEQYLQNLQVIIHSGGLGERWKQITNSEFAKPRTEIGKNPRPMLDWVIIPYIQAGVKKFFVSLWHNPDSVIAHCEEIKKNTGIDFEYLIEPQGTRFGRAGIIKKSFEEGKLDKNKPILSLNGSDILKFSLHEFVSFHMDSLEKGFSGSVIAVRSVPTEFGVMKSDDSGRVTEFKEKPIIELTKNEFVNSGVVILNEKLNEIIMEINESDFPINIEDSKNDMIRKIWYEIRSFPYAIPDKNWYFCKSPKDYKKINEVDLEKFLGIDNVESLLGKY